MCNYARYELNKYICTKLNIEATWPVFRIYNKKEHIGVMDDRANCNLTNITINNEKKIYIHVYVTLKYVYNTNSEYYGL